MAYVPKTWVDRVTEYPNRRLLTETGITDTYEVTRAEGTITAEGDKINMTNLNGLETRVSAAFKAMGVDTYTCTKTGTIFDLVNSNSPENGKFLSPASYVAGDVFRVNPTSQKFNKDLVVAGYIDSTDGTVKTSAVSNYSSALITINPSTAYKIVGHTYTQPVATVGIAWYNSAGVYISGTSYGSATGNGTYTSPSTAYYARYTVNTLNLSVSIFELNSSSSTDPAYTAAYTIRTSNGVELASGAFVSGATIPITLDVTNHIISFDKLAYTAAEVGALPSAKLAGVISSSATLTSAQSGMLLTASSSSVITITLPAPSTNAQFDIFSNYSSFILSSPTFLYDLATTTGGVTSLTIPSWRCLHLVTDGYNWIITTDDYASFAPNTVAATTAALRNIVILPTKSAALPAGLADNTLVFRKNVT